MLSEEKIKAKKQKKESENSSPSTRMLDDPSTPKLTPQQRSLLGLLQANERRFQWPTAEDVKKVTVRHNLANCNYFQLGQGLIRYICMGYCIEQRKSVW